MNYRIMLILLLGLLPIGCGESSEDKPILAEVSGIVTLDGKPLLKASVVFLPIAEGQVSGGVTDENGKYSLMYEQSLSGAVLGKHQVEIRTGGETLDSDGNMISEIEEILPNKYHTNSTLSADVNKGPNTIDFALKRK